jgi:hypothetical protein
MIKKIELNHSTTILQFLIMIFLIGGFSINGIAQEETEGEDSVAVKLHRSMIQNNLYTEKVDTSTNIGTWLNKNKKRFASQNINGGTSTSQKDDGSTNGPMRTASGCGMGFNDGDLLNWDFYMGYNHSPTSARSVCYMPHTTLNPILPSVPTDIQSKFKIYDRNASITDDPFYNTYIKNSEFSDMPNYFLRLGNYSMYSDQTAVVSDATSAKKFNGGSGSCNSHTTAYGLLAEKAEYEFVVNSSNKLMNYFYTFVGSSAHIGYQAPHFKLTLIDKGVGGTGPGVAIACFDNLQVLSPSLPLPGFTCNSPGSYLCYKGWKKNIVDLSAYVGKTVVMRLEVANCVFTGHFGTLYFAAQCIDNIDVDVSYNGCATNFELIGTNDNYNGEVYTWDFGDGSPTATGNPVTHLYATAGTYTVSTTYQYNNETLNESTLALTTTTCNINFSNALTLVPTGDCFPCTDCSTFSPEAGTYILSAWVKEGAVIDPNKLTYTSPNITLDYGSGFTPDGPFLADGNVIEGWQRIEKEFTIPTTTSSFKIILDCVSGDCFFDDIRIYPKIGSMKSYVYDPINLRLVAELDERNYATMYEYDEEGKLVRVKKETERGVMTIKENKNSTTKK